MRIHSHVKATALALLCSTVLAGTATFAQTESGNQLNPSPEQSRSILDSTRHLDAQGGDFTPTLGAKIPDDLQLHPMPSAAAAAMPEARDHHVVKTDDDTVAIADPDTRKVVGIASTGDVTGSTGDDGTGNGDADKDGTGSDGTGSDGTGSDGSAGGGGGTGGSTDSSMVGDGGPGGADAQ